MSLIINRSTTTYLGILLFVAFIVQSIVQMAIEPLYTLQQDEIYKRWSGLGVTIFILLQWVLTLCRLTFKSKSTDRLMVIHKWMGALTPLLFFIHSMTWGYEITLVLAITFFFNFVLGLLNVQAIKTASPKIYSIWFGTHILLSVIITFLTILHIWFVFYFE